MPVQGRRQQQCDLRHWAALPQPLLELMLVDWTNTEEKKVLRQTCNLFQKAIDDRLSCLKLSVDEARWHCDDHEWAVELLKHMQHATSLKTIVIASLFSCPLDRLLDYLPSHITTLRIDGSVTKTTALKQLPLLTSLSLSDGSCTIAELTGLTYLRCNKRVGTSEPCVRELKHLNSGAIRYTQRIDKLTKLEVLYMNNITSNFFAKHSQLPLKHLSIMKPSYGKYVLCDDHTWESAPTTLTRLTIDATCKMLQRECLSRILPSMLPAHITHLQLKVYDIYIIRQAVTALPALRQFDICSGFDTLTPRDILVDVSKLANLQCLAICVEYIAHYHWYDVQRCNPQPLRLNYNEVISMFPSLKREVERGVKLNVITDDDELESLFGREPAAETSWDVCEAASMHQNA